MTAKSAVVFLYFFYGHNRTQHTWRSAFSSNGFLIGHPCIFFLCIHIYTHTYTHTMYTYIHICMFVLYAMRNEYLFPYGHNHTQHTAPFFQRVSNWSSLYFHSMHIRVLQCAMRNDSLPDQNHTGHTWLNAALFSLSGFQLVIHAGISVFHPCIFFLCIMYIVYPCCTRCTMNLYFFYTAQSHWAHLTLGRSAASFANSVYFWQTIESYVSFSTG